MAFSNASGKDPLISRLRWKSTFGSLAFAACCVPGARAQVAEAPAGDAGPALDEIVVTATRRAESIDKIPVSITAFTQETMDQQGVKTVDDLARFTPGLTFAPAGDGLTNSIAIRGIASGVGASTTGIYIDDTPIQVRSGTGIVTENTFPQIFDLARVEVLKGPQGTLFGTGSMGGTIRFITPDPDLHNYSGYDRVETSFTKGGQPSYEMGAAGGGPIVDGTVGFRASVFYQSLGGFVNREPFTGTTVTEKGYNFDDTTVFRAAVKWAPSDDLSITPSVYYQKKRKNDDYFWLNISNPGESDFNSGFTQPEPTLDRFTLPALNVHWKMSGAELISVTSFFYRNETRDSDYSNTLFSSFGGTPTPTPPLETYRNVSEDAVRQNSFTQEVRLQSTSSGDLQWVVGALYQNSRLYTNQYIYDPDFNALTETYLGGSPQSIFGEGLWEGLYSFAVDQWAKDKQSAVFGQVDYSFTSYLKATAGVRVARTTLDYNRVFEGPLVCKLCEGTPETIAGETPAATPVTPRLELSYTPDSHDLYYVSASKGARVGGVNNPSVGGGIPGCPSGLTVPPTYAPDSLWDYEFGAKNQLFDGKLRLQASVFYINWHNVQQAVNSNTCLTTSYKTNLGNANVKGFDFSAELRPIESLTTTLSGGYQRARYSSTAYGPPDNTGARAIIEEAGDSLGVSPWNATLSEEYVFPAFSEQGYFRLDYSYTAKDNAETPELDSRTEVYDPALLNNPCVKLLDARLGFRLAGADISVFARNLLNNTPPLGLNHDAPGDPLFYAVTTRPRTVGITGTYRF